MKENLLHISECILMFIISAFIGWIYEIICVLIIYGQYYDRGILHLPFCPIYGFGMLVLYIIFHKVKNKGIIFIGSAIITTLVELITSYVAEYKFHIIMWTYEGWPLNFQNRISLISSMIFGLMALVFMLIIKPAIEKLYKSKYVIVVSISTMTFFLFCICWEVIHII